MTEEGVLGQEVAQLEGKSVVVAAGGTGGHVFPALATAEALQALGAQIDWVGTEQGIEAKVVPNAGIELHCLAVKGVRGKGLVKLLAAPWMVLGAVLSAIKLLRRLKPIGVVGMGGYVTGPVGVAAWLLGIPLLIHEQNAVAGLTNKWLSKVSRKVLTAFPGAFDVSETASKYALVGNPIRESIAMLDAPESRLANRGKTVRLLVLGGSLGALAINQVLPQALAQLLGAENGETQIDNVVLQVWHQTGHNHHAQTVDAYEALQESLKLQACSNGEDPQSGGETLYSKVEPFIDDMAQAYAWADLIICRAGALTVSEIAAVGVASIFIPFPHAVDDHQTRNAEALVAAEAARILPQSELDGKSLAQLLAPIITDRTLLQSMAYNGRKLAKPNATNTVVNEFLEVAL